MKRYNIILESLIEPEDKNVLWLYKGKIMQFTDSGWESISSNASIEVNTDDLSIAGDGKLELANRDYITKDSIKGYKILRKNVIDNDNILIQEMINTPNTIYEIRYNFDLGGREIILPEGSVLEFFWRLII